MKKVLKYFFILIFILIFTVQVDTVKAITTFEIDSQGNYYFDYETTDFDNYYSDMDGINSNLYRETLHNIISSGDIKVYTYSQVTDELKKIDEDINNKNNILCILTGRSMSKDSFGVGGTYGWNREHIWPKSHGFNSEGLAAYTDLHHLRAAEAYTNSTYHNDYDYGNADGGVSDAYGNTYYNKDNSPYGYPVYEPRDAAKGDIARMIMYMDIRYEGDSLSNNIDLSISSTNTSPSSGKGEIGLLETLIKWHEEDPVDDLERRRNDMVYLSQGNRNPFIDHPEYANYIYDANYDVLEEDEYRVLYYVNDGEIDYVDLNQYKYGDKVITPISPISSRYDYTFSHWETADGVKFNFETDKITETLKLYAKWEYTPLPVVEMLERMETKSALHLVYRNVETDNSMVIETTEIIPSATEGGSFTSKKNQILVYDEFLNYNKNDLQVTYETNNKTSVYVGKGKIRLYPGGGNGTAIKITGKDGNGAKIHDVNVTSNTKNNLKITIASDNSYAYIQNVSSNTSGDQIDITKISVSYYVDTISEEPVFDKIGIVFGTVFEKEFYDDLLVSGNEVLFGVKIDGVEYLVTPVLTLDGYKVSYEVITSSYSIVYKATVFVKVDGSYYYLKDTSHSVKTLSNLYLTDYINTDMVYEHRIALKFLNK